MKHNENGILMKDSFEMVSRQAHHKIIITQSFFFIHDLAKKNTVGIIQFECHFRSADALLNLI